MLISLNFTHQIRKYRRFHKTQYSVILLRISRLVYLRTWQTLSQPFSIFWSLALRQKKVWRFSINVLFPENIPHFWNLHFSGTLWLITGWLVPGVLRPYCSHLQGSNAQIFIVPVKMWSLSCLETSDIITHRQGAIFQMDGDHQIYTAAKA